MNTSTSSYNYVSNGVIQDILAESIVPKEELLHGYIIVINGNIFSNGNKSFIFPSKEQAVKAFYSTFRWRAHYKIARAEFGDRYYERSLPVNYSKNAWIRFKKTLEDKYNFEIVQL